MLFRAEQQVDIGSQVQGVFGKFSFGAETCNRDQSLPPACGLPKGDGGSGVLITTLSLFDPTDSMAIRPLGTRGNSCTLMVMAHGPDVTTDTWCRPGKLSGISSDSSQQPCDNHWWLTVKGHIHSHFHKPSPFCLHRSLEMIYSLVTFRCWMHIFCSKSGVKLFIFEINGWIVILLKYIVPVSWHKLRGSTCLNPHQSTTQYQITVVWSCLVWVISLLFV